MAQPSAVRYTSRHQWATDPMAQPLAVCYTFSSQGVMVLWHSLWSFVAPSAPTVRSIGHRVIWRSLHKRS